jgi:protein phosphatase 2C family protein 2/3
VTCFPDVSVRKRIDGKDDFIMLACDGIWDCLSSEQCIEDLRTNYIKKAIKQKKPISYAVELMLDEILAPNTEDGIGTDNMTALLIMFKNGKANKQA